MLVVWEWDFALPGLCSPHFGFLAHYSSSGLIARELCFWVGVCVCVERIRFLFKCLVFLFAGVTLAQADLELTVA